MHLPFFVLLAMMQQTVQMRLLPLLVAAAAAPSLSPLHEAPAVAPPCAPIRKGTGAPCGNYTLGFKNTGVFSIDTLESSMFRFHGQLYMLEGIGCVFDRPLWQNRTSDGMDPAFANRSYFRIREVGSGRVVVNIPGSQGFGFPNAFVDYDHGQRLWVFGTPQDRCHAHSPGPGIHAWHTDDLQRWVTATVAGTAGVTTPNVDVARVRMSPSEAASRGLPPHRYVMILEGKGPTHNAWDWSGGPEFMLNDAPDGNLLTGWVSTKFLITNHSKHVLGCPSIRYQRDGYYYAVTGMGIWNGIVRSRDLRNWTYGAGTGGGGVGDWWLSGGMIRPTANDGTLGPYNKWLSSNTPSYWPDLVAPANMQQWDGHSSDPVRKHALSFAKPFCIKMVISLSRQARDTHR